MCVRIVRSLSVWLIWSWNCLWSSVLSRHLFFKRMIIVIKWDEQEFNWIESDWSIFDWIHFFFYPMSNVNSWSMNSIISYLSRKYQTSAHLRVWNLSLSSMMKKINECGLFALQLSRRWGSKNIRRHSFSNIGDKSSIHFSLSLLINLNILLSNSIIINTHIFSFSLSFSLSRSLFLALVQSTAQPIKVHLALEDTATDQTVFVLSIKTCSI